MIKPISTYHSSRPVEKPVARPLASACRLHADEVMVEVMNHHAGSVDWQTCNGRLSSLIDHHGWSGVLGWEGAGRVIDSGSAVKRLSHPGDVYFFCDTPLAAGADYPPYVILPERRVAYMPSNVSYFKAARLPVAATTALGALFTIGALPRNARLLVLGAESLAARFVVQLAKQYEVYVVAIPESAVSLDNSVLRQACEADMVIPGPLSSCEGECFEFDLIIDCAGGSLLANAVKSLRPNGRLISVVDPVRTQALKAGGYEAEFVFVSPTAADLDEITGFFEKGLLT